MMLHLKWAKELRIEGERLGRAGMSERVLAVVVDFANSGMSYKEAMILAGRMKAISHAAKCDGYWDEQVSKGYHREMHDITRFTSPTAIPSVCETGEIR